MPFRIPLPAVICLIMAVPALLCRSIAQQAPSGHDTSPTVEQRTRQLHALFDEEWEYNMHTHPEWATALGDNRFNDRLSDDSLQAILADDEHTRDFLKRIEALDPSGFSTQDALSRTLMIRNLHEAIEGMQFKHWEMPVNQMNGIHLWLFDMVSLTPFNSTADYEHYLSRLHQMPRVLDQAIENMRQGMRDGLMPPRFLLEKVAAEADDVIAKSGDAGPFAKPLQKFPASVAAADQQRLRTQVLAAIDNEVLPAYKRFSDFVRTDYAPHGRSDPGVWSLPDGAARYRYEIQRMTTTNLTADEIHQIGLRQVDEIEVQMLQIARQLGFNDVAGLNEHIKQERRFYATSGQQLLELYAKYARQMEARLPQLFGRLPRNKLDVIPMDPFRAKNAVPADYSPGAPDGSRPGHINVNQSDPDRRLLLNVEAIAYHEGVPGHHLQFSIAQELPELPAFRRHSNYTAYTEGWALYAERLGKEVGFYEDPYSNYGRLENEMWRAIRLVIDTGVHEKHWSRQQMVDYFHRYTAMDEPNIQNEVDRYIAWPGQALAYKLGQMEFLKLRDAARQKLGDKFDLRAFHDEVLSHGPLPLDVLDSETNSWIAVQEKH